MSSQIDLKFRSILDKMDQPIYISDPDTYEILYVNEKMKILHEDELVGKKCHESFHNLDVPCSFCTNYKLFGKNPISPYTWEHYNEKLDRWYYCTDQAIEWGVNKKVRLETAIDITEQKQAEELQQKKYRKIINGIVDIIIESNIKGKITYISPQVNDILGYQPNDLLGSNVDKYIHSDDFMRIEDLIKKAIKSNKTIIYESRVRHKNGRYISMIFRAKILKLGDKLKVVGVLSDISKEKEAKQQLKESEEKYRNLINNVSDVIIETDLKGMIFYVSPKAHVNFGFKPEELIGQKIFKFIHPEELSIMINEIKEAISLKENISVGFRMLHKNGNYIFVLAKGNLVEINNEKRLIGVISDITEQKHSQQIIRESKQMLQLVMDNIPQFIFWKDINSIYLGCNTNFARVAGVGEPENIIGKSDYDLPWRKSEAETTYETDRLVMESDKPEYHIIEPQLQADGKEAWLDTNKIPLHDSQGNVVGLLGTHEDISERVLAEKTLKKSEKKYREAYNNANFLKDLFSHDMSNILQSIQMAYELNELYIEQKSIENLKDLARIIKELVRRGAKLVDNTRKLTEIETFDNPASPINLKAIIDQSIKNVRNRFDEKSINIHIESFNANNFVQANDFLIDAFENILINAVLYNKNPIIEVKIKVSQEKKADQNFIKLEFSDNGIGIEDVRKETIFLRAFNKDKTISGLGLGLTLVKKIIESYKGYIWVENNIKGDRLKGSNFIVLIPRAE